MKRNLLNELKEGFTALQDAHDEKITLHTHSVENKPAPAITPERAV